MSFLEPLFLMGLLAVSVPVFIHLINRRRAIRRTFPAIAFLLRSNDRVARHAKVRQWALLALRMGVIGLLAFALAKPYMQSASGMAATDRLPTATVFVIDASYSMTHGDWWERARDRLEDRLDEARTWDEVAVVSTRPSLVSDEAGGRARLSTNHGEAREAFDDIRIEHAETDLLDGILRASDLLSTSQLPNRKIVIISDEAIGKEAPRAGDDARVPYPVEVESVRNGDEEPGNLAVVSVTYQQEGRADESIWRIDASVRNFGATDANDVQIRLAFGDELASAGLISVPAGRSTTHTFRHTLSGDGVQFGTVSLAKVPGDALELDNERHFVIHLRDKVKVLLVNGEPSSVVYQDEMFFLERALNPRQGSGSTIIPELVTREGLETAELAEFDVVVLANLARVTDGVASKLQAFVDDGGGLFVSMGDHVDVEGYNQTLAQLLPKKLRGRKRLAERGDPDAPVKVTRFGTVNRGHAIFRVFDLPGGAAISTIPVYSFMLLEPSPPKQSTTLLAYKDGAPALLERRVGKGTVLLLTTTVDFEWADLPIHHAFLPLMRRSVEYLARRGSSNAGKEHFAGHPINSELPGNLRDRVVVSAPGPEGEPVRMVVEPIEGRVLYRPAHVGFASIALQRDGDEARALPGLTAAINLDTSESDLRRLPADWLEAVLAPPTNGSQGAAAVSRPQKQIDIWPFVLFLVTLFLLVETVLGARRSVLVSVWKRLLGQPDFEDLET